MDNESRIRGAGGTPGGIGEFVLGVIMAVAGAYLITTQVVVTSGFWSIWGYNAFGLSLFPLLFGIGILFFNGKSIIGWALLAIGLVIIFTGIIMNLNIYFQRTSLFNTILMFVLLAGGIGLILRALAPHRERGAAS
jgi:predicted membrane channel-forming protein YqfA (hemolysin III family)